MRVKSNCDGDIRRFQLRGSPSFSQLHEQLRTFYGTTEFVVKYADDEGDLVTMNSDLELREAMDIHSDSGLLRVQVMRSRAVPQILSPIILSPPGRFRPQSTRIVPPSDEDLRAAPPVISALSPSGRLVPESTPSVVVPPPVDVPSAPSVNITPTPPVNAPLAPPVNITPTPPVNAPLAPPVNITPTPPVNAPPAPPVNITPTPPVNAPPAPPVNITPIPPVNITPTPPRMPSASERWSQVPIGGMSAAAEFSSEQVRQGLSGMMEQLLIPLMSMSGSLGSAGAGPSSRANARSGGAGGTPAPQTTPPAGGSAGPSRQTGANGRPAEGGFEWLRYFNMNEADISRFAQSFDPSSLGGDFTNIARQTMDNFRELITSLMRSPGAAAVMAAVPLVLPTIRGFLAEIGSGVPVTRERADALANALSAVLTVPLGATGAGRVAEFVRVAMGDQAVLTLLRRVSGIGAGSSATAAARDAGVEAVERVERAMRAAGRLDVHRGVTCDGCNISPIVGTRHKCTTRPNFDLCDRCIGTNSNGMTFQAIEYPWLVEAGRTLVPRPTLAYGSSGVEVMFLQHLLTQLGYMTPRDYRVRTGFYGPKTAAAVNMFRGACGLNQQGTYGVYDDIVAASLLSVIDAGVPPTATAGSAAGASSSTQGGAGSTDNAPTAA